MIDFDRLYGDDYFKNYGLGTATHQRQQRLEMYREEIARLYRYKTRGVVLDIGCGTGEFLSNFDASQWIRYGVEPVRTAREAAEKLGISFELSDLTRESLDLVIYRGTIQHLDEPLGSIKKSIELLRPGGMMVFLATPNAGSLCYRLFQNLPALDPPRNFCIFSSETLCQVLKNFGLSVERLVYPYLGTPYARPFRDHLAFLLRCFGIRSRFAFWRNMVEIYARKPY
jgi:SAM-dependent methyltransferase